ncbi:MAG: hypothetical protein NW207_09645 [Cytophagales bacterium]|nr:hypothetical protein [Cytophagales bacterium]
MTIDRFINKKLYKVIYDTTYIILILMLTPIYTTFAQSVRIAHEVHQKHILLKWAPDQPKLWIAGMKYGYKIERYTMVRDDLALPIPQPMKIIFNCAKPYPDSAWKAMYNATNDKYIPMAYELMYGKQFTKTPANASIAQIVEASKLFEKRYGMAIFCADQSFRTGILSGLAGVDSTVMPNEKYLYRVILCAPDTIAKADTGFVYADAGVETMHLKIKEIFVNFKDSAAEVYWYTGDYKKYYSGWYIERSDDGKNWVALHTQPIIQGASDVEMDKIYYTDSLPQNNKLYYYRVCGINYFGQRGPWSPVVKGMGKRRLPVLPIILGVVPLNNNQLTISWDFKEQYTEKIKHFEIYQSKKSTGRYKMIGKARKNQREFVVKNPLKVNYFYIKGVGVDSQQYNSTIHYYALKDSTPPAVPLGLRGKIDSTGRVYLYWNSNKEEDFRGYRLCYTNNLDEGIFNPFPTINDTFYVDSINIKTLTKKIYYGIGAVDNHFNFSGWSAMLELKRPDIIPPTSPLIVDITISISGVKLSWANSSSNDVAYQHLLRKQKNDSIFTIIYIDTVSKNKVSFYVDTKINTDQTYYYAMRAIDESNLKSVLSPAVKVLTPKNYYLNPIKEFKVTPKFEEGIVALSWQYTSKDSITAYLLYKKENNNPLKLYKTLPANMYEYNDKTVFINNNYSYTLRAKGINGKSSPFTQEITIKY